MPDTCCRACGAELRILKVCKSCGEPKLRGCIRCSTMLDSGAHIECKYIRD